MQFRRAGTMYREQNFKFSKSERDLLGRSSWGRVRAFFSIPTLQVSVHKLAPRTIAQFVTL